MITFLFEQYGYYPKVFQDNTFVIDGWFFKLLEVDYDEKYIEEIDEYCAEIRKFFSEKGPYIIRTRFNKLVSIHDQKQYVLISFYDYVISINDLNAFHVKFRQLNKKIELKKMLLSWEDKISYLENNLVNALRVDSVYHQKNIEIAMFCLGLCQNAVQYLSECIFDYGGTVDDITLAHRRLKSLKSEYVLNPFNLVIDHPARDLIELYRNDFLKFDDFIDIIKYYELDKKTATICIARLLYPCEQLDLLEKNIFYRNISFKLDYSIEKEYMKIKKVYEYFKTQYNIRPINWLEY